LHFVTGGAYNGKRKWVKANYSITQWISAYEEMPLPEDLYSYKDHFVVLEGLEYFVRNSSSSREEWRQYFKGCLDWEAAVPSRQVIIIGTDISKGIVPMEKENRTWRDMTGWVYQDLAAICDKVDVMWYGINQTIKG
jgi:adenosylcobinamide kinase / adenosylcobinamide-phosphate guanylyltransferase